MRQKYPDRIDEASQAALDRFSPKLDRNRLGKIPALWIRPRGKLLENKLLIYLHGGAYTLYGPESTLCISVPIACASKILTVSLGYTPAPDAHWRQISDEILSAIRALLDRGYRASDLAILGESAGGSLASAIALRMRDEQIGLPAAVVLWSPWSDVTETGDSYHTLKGEEVMFDYKNFLAPAARAYASPKDFRNPWVSPVHGDYSKGYCPTLIQGGTRELFLSNMVRQYQAIDQAGGSVKLDLYEGMWHVFQLQLDMPEAVVARKKTTDFLRAHLRD